MFLRMDVEHDILMNATEQLRSYDPTASCGLPVGVATPQQGEC